MSHIMGTLTTSIDLSKKLTTGTKMQLNISVVITCYKEGSLLLDAVNSVLSQAYPAQEIILVNDASEHEETNRICQELAQNPLIQVIWRQINGGTSAAINTGFAAAQGEFVFCLDGDDLIPEQAIAQIMASLSQNPNAGFVYGGYIRQEQASEVAIYPEDISLKTMLSSKRFSLSSKWNLIRINPLRKTLWEQLGGYDPDFGVTDLHDVEFWIRVLASGCEYHYIPSVIYIWRKYLGSNSRKISPLAWYRLVKKHLSIYKQVELEYRAYELLLLGSKWLNNLAEVEYYSNQLAQSIQRGKFSFSSIVILLIPNTFLQFFANQAQKNR
jgi:glycosyltransferase involved in cell wall biosynthesis